MTRDDKPKVLLVGPAIEAINEALAAQNAEVVIVNHQEQIQQLPVTFLLAPMTIPELPHWPKSKKWKRRKSYFGRMER